jgi:hypothetical protein
VSVVEAIVNVAIKAPFVSVSNTTGLSSFSNVHVLKDGVITSPSITYAEIGSGLYVATFTPTTTGLYTLFIEQKIQGEFKVVAKSLYTFLQNVEDVGMGSWTWDKNTGELLFKRQDGTDLAGFDVVDNLTTASRERTTP